MLKKVGIAAAIATAGLLALSPVAFAKEYQDNDQFNAQGEGEGNGQNEASGMSEQLVCNLFQVGINPVTGNGDAVENYQGSAGACNNQPSHIEDQTYQQHKSNH